MKPVHFILIVLYLLMAVVLLRKIMYIRKAEEKAVISVINKKHAVLIAAVTILYIVFIVFLFKIFGFDIKELLEIILELFPLLLFTEGFCCITPDGIVGDSLTNKGLEPKENFSYRFTFKGRHQTECLEIYSRGQKKPRTYFGGIKNDELIKILEENYEPYIKDYYAHHD